MDRFFLEQRRSLPGQAWLKRAILDVLRVIDREIAHYAILGADPARNKMRQETKALRAHVVAELLACTKDSK